MEVRVQVDSPKAPRFFFICAQVGPKRTAHLVCEGTANLGRQKGVQAGFSKPQKNLRFAQLILSPPAA
jgi:hypothetical protein